ILSSLSLSLSLSLCVYVYVYVCVCVLQLRSYSRHTLFEDPLEGEEEDYSEAQMRKQRVEIHRRVGQNYTHTHTPTHLHVFVCVRVCVCVCVCCLSPLSTSP